MHVEKTENILKIKHKTMLNPGWRTGGKGMGPDAGGKKNFKESLINARKKAQKRATENEKRPV